MWAIKLGKVNYIGADYPDSLILMFKQNTQNKKKQEKNKERRKKCQWGLNVHIIFQCSNMKPDFLFA